MKSMEQHLRKMAEEFKKKHPYSEEELLKIIEICQNSAAAKENMYSSLDNEISIIYWYYIEDICISIRRFYPSEEAYFDRDDLIEEAILHLFDAVRTYDLHGSVSFRSWIMRISRNAVSRTVWENQKKIRVPRSFAKKISKYLTYIARHIEETGLHPARGEIMTALSLTDGECRILERYASIEFTAEISGNESADFLYENDNGAKTIEKQAVELYVRDSLQEILKECLTQEENMFLSMCMGLNGSARYDTETLSKLFGVTPGEIIASVHAIKEKLKKNRKLKELAECYGL